MNTLYDIPFKNVMRRPIRSALLLLFAFIMSVSVMIGGLLINSIKQSLKILEHQLGADIIVVPYEARTKLSIDAILSLGNRRFYYMNSDYLKAIYELEGVKNVSFQTYVSSLHENYSLIVFDYKTDFVVKPWFLNTSLKKDELSSNVVIVGSDVDFVQDGKIELFGKEYKVTSRLFKTGIGLDNAIYISADIANELKNFFTDERTSYSDSLVTSIFVKVDENYSVESVKNDINLSFRKLKAVQSKSAVTNVSLSLANFSNVVSFLVAFIWIFSLCIMTIIFSMLMNERKCEFALLQIMGVTRKKIKNLIFLESLFINILGTLITTVVLYISINYIYVFMQRALSVPLEKPSFILAFLIFLVANVISAVSALISSLFTVLKIINVDASALLKE